MSHLLRNLLIALGLAIVLWIGYVVFLGSDDSELLSESAGTASAVVSFRSQELLAKLQELERYDVKGEVLSDPAFASLVDFRVDLGTEPTGRTNPFLPVR